MTILNEDEKMHVFKSDGSFKSKSVDVLDNLFLESATFYSDPEKYLEPSDTMRKEVLSITKKMYDFMKEYDVFSNQNSLNELLVSGFDNEQIWQEIQLQNAPCLSKTKICLKALDIVSVNLLEVKNPSKGKAEGKKEKKKRKKKKEKSAKEVDIPDVFSENDFDEEMDDNEKKVMEPKKKYKKTIVDDGFFRLREMEEYVDRLDRIEEMKDDNDVLGKDHDSDNDDGVGGEIDFFKDNLGSSDEDDDDDDEENDDLQYKDFFDPPEDHVKSLGNKIEKIEKDEVNEDDEGEEDDDNVDDNAGDKGEESDLDMVSDSDGDEIMEIPSDANESDQIKKGDEKKVESTFERKQRLMLEKIKRLEEENLSEKPWQLMGETNAKKRPVNSLLEEFVTFDVTSAGAPVITEETTLSLEDLIKRRIKDKAWDDVIRKEKPSVQPYEFKRAPELNQEKSKLSLAEVYEKEYLKQAETDKEEKENEEHVNIQNLMDRLFVQLDALSNFHFTPKPPQPEIKIITNVPSVQIEEVLPVTMSEASQLAPEEVFEKKKAELVGDEEKTTQGRKRERRQKKIKKKFASKEKERKEKLKAQKAGKVAKSETKQAMDSLKKGVRNTIVNSSKSDAEKNIKSSNEFFNKLQNEVKNNISKVNMKPNKKKKLKTAESLKL